MTAQGYTRYWPRSVSPAPLATNITIRFATIDDLPGLTTLFDAYRLFYGLASNPSGARDFLAARLSAGESVVLLAIGESHEDVLGFAQLFRAFSSLSLGTVIVLNDLFVVPCARQRGVGGRLVDAAADYATQCGALRVDLEAHRDNAPAMRLYRAKGFVWNSEFAHMSRSIGS